MKVAAVVPTCRGFTIPEQTIPVDWYVVHDREAREVVGHAKHIVAPVSDLYGRRCDSIRSAGFLWAYQDGANYILTVDDDCKIPANWAEDHVTALEYSVSPWSSTMRQYRPRGLPYEATAPVAISHGLWDGVPDLDGITQKKTGQVQVKHDGVWRSITAPFPQSAMNFGFRREVAAVMYQPFQGEGTPFDRYADIWGGLLAQRVLSRHGWSFMNGGAVVHHDRASDVDVNIEKERPGMEAHESFWRWVWDFEDYGSTLESSYLRLADHVANYPGDSQWDNYFSRLARNMRTWVHSLDRVKVSAS